LLFHFYFRAAHSPAKRALNFTKAPEVVPLYDESGAMVGMMQTPSKKKGDKVDEIIETLKEDPRDKEIRLLKEQLSQQKAKPKKVKKDASPVVQPASLPVLTAAQRGAATRKKNKEAKLKVEQEKAAEDKEEKRLKDLKETAEKDEAERIQLKKDKAASKKDKKGKITCYIILYLYCIFGVCMYAYVTHGCACNL